MDPFTFTVKVTDDGNPNLSDEEEITVTVTEVNQAPVLDNSGALELDTLNEDDTDNSGTLITDLLASGGGTPISDADPGAVQGIAVIAADTTNGSWQYSTDGGQNWSTLNSVSDSNARLLAADAITRIRFVPNANSNGTVDPAITFRAWDQTTGTNGGTADTSTNGGTTAFSMATETASISVTAVNDAPELDDSNDLQLDPIDENAFTNAGTLISDLLASGNGTPISDVDAGAVAGIAITAADTANGTWESSTDNGQNWFALGSVSDSNARLLAADASTRIRFVPAQDYNGTVQVAITFRAWDQTSGSNGSTVDTSTNGGTTAFSTDTETGSITVNPV